jgi:hypothetical protein
VHPRKEAPTFFLQILGRVVDYSQHPSKKKKEIQTLFLTTKNKPQSDKKDIVTHL